MAILRMDYRKKAGSKN
uniref:Uncharacterized protein n=1 Tax=Rhizophora mucronata TaxID=61149 RepID=A0A2P2NKN8_RHIMU